MVRNQKNTQETNHQAIWTKKKKFNREKTVKSGKKIPKGKFPESTNNRYDQSKSQFERDHLKLSRHWSKLGEKGRESLRRI